MENEKRKVVLYKYDKTPGENYYQKIPDGHGIFHQFGVNYEEFESVPGLYTSAIVEMPDGSIRNVPVELVVFNN